jgi:hypothetical protein
MGLPVRVIRTRKRQAPYLGTLRGGPIAVKNHQSGRGWVSWCVIRQDLSAPALANSGRRRQRPRFQTKVDGRKGDRSVSLRCATTRRGVASFRWLRFLPVHGAANITSAIEGCLP